MIHSFLFVIIIAYQLDAIIMDLYQSHFKTAYPVGSKFLIMKSKKVKVKEDGLSCITLNSFSYSLPTRGISLFQMNRLRKIYAPALASRNFKWTELL